jgi:hypothetical protein
MNNMKCKSIDEVSYVVRHVDLVLARLNQADYGILRICNGN